MGTRVLSLIHEDGRTQLRAAVPLSWTLQSLSSAADLTAALKSFGVGRTVVLDPAIVQVDALERILSAAERSGAGVLLYSSLDSRSVERVLDVVTRLPAEVLFYGVDDERVILARLLTQLPFSSVPALVLRRLAPSLKHLPPPLRIPAVGLFGWAASGSLNDVQEHLEVSSSSVRRAVHGASLESLARLRDCARLARVCERMLTTAETLTMIADREGFESLRTLEDQFARIIAIPPSQARAKLSADEMANRLAAGSSR
jgi:AraC-like DNA-binding protein